MRSGLHLDHEGRLCISELETRQNYANVWPSCWSREEKWSAGSRGGWSSAPGLSGPAAFSATSASPEMQTVMNLKIKFRESFRPFAPAVASESVADYFEMDADESPYMLLVAPVKPGRSLNRQGKQAPRPRSTADPAFDASRPSRTSILGPYPDGRCERETAVPQLLKQNSARPTAAPCSSIHLQRPRRADRLHA